MATFPLNGLERTLLSYIAKAKAATRADLLKVHRISYLRLCSALEQLMQQKLLVEEPSIGFDEFDAPFPIVVLKVTEKAKPFLADQVVFRRNTSSVYHTFDGELRQLNPRSMNSVYLIRRIAQERERLARIAHLIQEHPVRTENLYTQMRPVRYVLGVYLGDGPERTRRPRDS